MEWGDIWRVFSFLLCYHQLELFKCISMRVPKRFMNLWEFPSLSGKKNTWSVEEWVKYFLFFLVIPLPQFGQEFNKISLSAIRKRWNIKVVDKYWEKCWLRKEFMDYSKACPPICWEELVKKVSTFTAMNSSRIWWTRKNKRTIDLFYIFIEIDLNWIYDQSDLI